LLYIYIYIYNVIKTLPSTVFDGALSYPMVNSLSTMTPHGICYNIMQDRLKIGVLGLECDFLTDVSRKSFQKERVGGVIQGDIKEKKNTLQCF
jgi:hypothetical protein